MEVYSERQALLRKSAGNESKSQKSNRSQASVATNRSNKESDANKSAKTSVTSNTEEEGAPVKAKRPQMLREKEFEKSAFSWIFTFLYIACVWILGAAFMYGVVLLIQSRVSERPLYFGTGSFIGGTPRVVFEPNPARYDINTRGVISFKPDDANSFINLMVRYKKLLKGEYSGSMPLCSTVNGAKNGSPNTNGSCAIDFKDDTDMGYGPCKLTLENLETGMGFAEKEPCIMLRLSKILGWYPKLASVASNTPQNRTCPEGGRECCHTNRIKFTCEGAEYRMYPADGMDTCGFPYWNKPPHHTPFVMLKFNLTQVSGKKTVTCKADYADIAKMEDNQENIAKFVFDV